jgi:hypothetical protein
VSGRVEQWLHRSERTPDRTVDEGVAKLLEAVRRGAQRAPGESWPTSAMPPAHARAAHAGFNYIFTVPGDTLERLVLVAPSSF